MPKWFKVYEGPAWKGQSSHKPFIDACKKDLRKQTSTKYLNPCVYVCVWVCMSFFRDNKIYEHVDHTYNYIDAIVDICNIKYKHSV